MFRFELPEFLRIKKTPRNALLAAAAVIVCLLAVVSHIYSDGKSSIPATGPYYYSTDDGKTFYASGHIHIPPFTKSGKKAVAAAVYVGSRGRPFVAYIYTYDPTGHDLLLGLPKFSGQVIDNGPMRQQAAQDSFVSKPGGKKWVPWNSPAGQKIENVTNPATGQPLRPYTGW